jgi:hypothetical protein
MQPQETYSQLLIFFVIVEWDLYAQGFFPIKPFQPVLCNALAYWAHS